MPTQQPADPHGKPSIYVPFDPGGGGEGGYVFTDLAHLDSVIAQWQTFHEDIREDGTKIAWAARAIVPPTDDGPSVNQSKAARNFLLKGVRHNEAMRVYAERYIARLTATRAQYAADDEGNANLLRNVRPE